LGKLIARQAEAWAAWGHEETYGKTCANLPDDTINFQHDPLTCAIALGWRDGVLIEETPLRTIVEDKLLFTVHDEGKPTKVVTKIDGNRFNKFWLDIVSFIS
jgi:purine nucleosidase